LERSKTKTFKMLITPIDYICLIEGRWALHFGDLVIPYIIIG